MEKAKDTIRNMLNIIIGLKMTDIEQKQNKDMEELSIIQHSIDSFRLVIDNLRDNINNQYNDISKIETSSRNFSNSKTTDSSEKTLKSYKTVSNLKTTKINEIKDKSVPRKFTQQPLLVINEEENNRSIFKK